MELNVASVSKSEGFEEKIDLTDDLSGSEIDFSGEKIVILSPIEVHGSMVNQDGKIDVKILIVTDIKRFCSRCLESYKDHICVESNLVFAREGKNLDEELDVNYFKNDRIDISDIILKDIIAAITMKPLCKEDCKGLCAFCGKNKNNTECDCKEDNIDPRMKALSKLLQSE